LVGVESFTRVGHQELKELASSVLRSIDCTAEVADEVSEHLVETDLAGIASHGTLRLVQYVEHAKRCLFTPSASPTVSMNEHGAWIVNGHGGFGISAMNLAVKKGSELMLHTGMATVAVVNCGHSGRIGSFAEDGARLGALTIIIGGGSHEGWKQVAPYGGAKGRLPTNPYAFGIPGDDDGPVVLDFATAAAAGGWIVAAQSAGAMLPDGLIMDQEGQATNDPDKYVSGGSLLPFGGPKGYGMGLLAEILGFALLGPFTQPVKGLGLNHMVIMIDTKRFRGPDAFMAASKAVLDHVRDCPPAQGFDAVEIPGHRERAHAAKLRREGVPIPDQTWQKLRALFEGKEVTAEKETNDGGDTGHVVEEPRAKRCKLEPVN